MADQFGRDVGDPQDALAAVRCVEELLDLIRDWREGRWVTLWPELFGLATMDRWWDGRPIVDVIQTL